MRIITVKHPLVLNDTDENRIPIAPNVEYVVPDQVIGILQQDGFAESIIRNDNFYDCVEYKVYTGQNLNGKTLIFFRNGGIGDLIFPIPSVKALKLKFPEAKFYVCCNDCYRCLFEPLDFIDGVVTLPLPLTELLKKDYYVNFEGLIEGISEAERAKAETTNAYELHAQRFHVVPETYAPELKVLPDAEAQVLKEIERWKSCKRIVIAYSASVAIRSVNPELYKELIDNTTNQNIKWFIVGSKNQQKEIEKFIKSCVNKNKIVNWTQEKFQDLKYTMALIRNCHCVIAPDSGLLHIAGGLGVPLVGLYGAFPSALRIKHYNKSKTIGIDAITSCVFGRGEWKCCFQHGSGSCNLARKVYEKYSPCMTVIKVNALIKALKALQLLPEDFPEEVIKK